MSAGAQNGAAAVVQAIDALVAAADRVEERLEAAGEPNAHAWTFALREVLLDYRRVLPRVAELPSAADDESLRRALRDLAAEILYTVAPHAEHHLGELIESLDQRG